MLTATPQTSTEQFELVRLPSGGWAVTDLARPHEDPRCLVAYVQEDGVRYEAVWVQAPVSVGWFGSLDEIVAEARTRKGPRAA